MNWFFIIVAGIVVLAGILFVVGHLQVRAGKTIGLQEKKDSEPAYGTPANPKQSRRVKPTRLEKAARKRNRRESSASGSNDSTPWYAFWAGDTSSSHSDHGSSHSSYDGGSFGGDGGGGSFGGDSSSSSD